MDWFRYHTSALDSRKVQTMPRKLTLDWLNFMCLQRLHGGVVLPKIEDCAFRLRISVEKATEIRDRLVELRFIDRLADDTYVMHDWDDWQAASDDSAARKRKQRADMSRSVSQPASRDTSRDMSQPCPVVEKNRVERDIEGEERESRADSPLDWRDSFESFIENLKAHHPRKSGNGKTHSTLAEYLEAALNPDREMEIISRRHQEYCAYWSEREEAEGTQAPQLDTWVEKTGWMDPPPRLRSKRPRSAVESLMEKLQ